MSNDEKNLSYENDVINVLFNFSLQKVDLCQRMWNRQREFERLVELYQTKSISQDRMIQETYECLYDVLVFYNCMQMIKMILREEEMSGLYSMYFRYCASLGKKPVSRKEIDRCIKEDYDNSKKKEGRVDLRKFDKDALGERRINQFQIYGLEIFENNKGD